MSTLYEVQEFTLCDGWVNVWHHTQDGSDEPMYFTSKEAAQAELEEHLLDCVEAVAEGFMSDTPNLEGFRIVEVQS